MKKRNSYFGSLFDKEDYQGFLNHFKEKDIKEAIQCGDLINGLSDFDNEEKFFQNLKNAILEKIYSFTLKKYIINTSFDTLISFLYYINLLDLLIFIIEKIQNVNEIKKEYFKKSYLFIIFYFLEEENSKSLFKFNSFYKPYYIKANEIIKHETIILNDVKYKLFNFTL